ncbi:hypothetical protein AX15_006623 [Amanita polypyramis BW_CC]|nr:hypothetical protein AX15_006623 [Amanita polypyramis BW_CC]
MMAGKYRALAGVPDIYRCYTGKADLNMQAVVVPRTSLFARFLSLRTIKSGVPSKFVNTQSIPVFQRIPPWWARWTWALIACDMFMTCSAIDLTWNHWSQLVSDLEKISVKNKERPGDGLQASAAPQEHYETRPVWQRLGLCASHLVLGAGVAVALLVTQARFVRTVAVIPPTVPKERRVFIQCAHNWRNHGTTFPLGQCSLEEGRNETEMILRVLGERGHWYVGLTNAIIHGQPVSMLEARNAILEEWKEGKRRGKWTSSTKVDDRWKSGPILRQGR